MPSNRFARLIIATVALFSLVLFGRNMQRRQLSEALLQAIMGSRVAEMKSLLLRGADAHLPLPHPDAPNARREPITEAFNRLAVLASAAPPAEVDGVVCRMLTQDSRASYRDKAGADYLRAACGAGCAGAVRLLLAKGADPLQVDERGGTALDTALQARQDVAAQIAANPPETGPIPASERLRLTLQSERVRLVQRLAAYDQTVQTLLAQGLRLNARQAVSSGNVALLRAALSESNPTPEERNTALCLAARSGQLDAVTLLLARGANVNAGQFGMMSQIEQTPLCLAILNRHEDVARYLLAQGADVNPPAGYTASPLSHAIANLPSLTPSLLRRGASVRHAGVMEAAVHANDPALVKDLLRRGASPDPVRPAYPVRHPHKPARPLAPYTSPDAPLNIAVRSAPACVEPLLQAGADLRRASPGILAAAIDSGHEALVPALVRAGARVHYGRELGTPALLTAVEKAPHLVGLLLDNGADANVSDTQAHTPLGLAALRDDMDAARLLLARGANVNLQPPRGHNALHYARESKHAAMTALLEQAGAKEDH